MFDLEIIYLYLKVVQKQAKEWVGAVTFSHVHCLSIQGDCIDCDSSDGGMQFIQVSKD